jgi:cell division protein FtsL
MNWFSKGYIETLEQLRKRRRRDLFTFLFIWFLTPLLAVSILIFTCRSHKRAMIRNLEEMQLEKVRLRGEHEELMREIADLSSRQRIYNYATEKLGMKYPEQDEMILVLFEGNGDAPGDGDVDDDGVMTKLSGKRERDRSSINILTHFFALYVF